MADLDDFFARKDKKKLKGKKFGNPDEIAKRLEEKERKLEKDKVEHKKPLDEVLISVVNNPEDEPPTKKEDEEEWKDFVEENEHDLTDLKLTKLQIDNEEDGVRTGFSHDDDGGPGSGDKADGVWGKSGHIERAAPVEEVAVPQEEQKPAVNNMGGSGSYLPPHLRHASSIKAVINRKARQAPDITNAMAFPSLADAKNSNLPIPWVRKKVVIADKGFENVKHGSVKSFNTNSSTPRLSTANRFDALSDRS